MYNKQDDIFLIFNTCSMPNIHFCLLFNENVYFFFKAIFPLSALPFILIYYASQSNVCDNYFRNRFMHNTLSGNVCFIVGHTERNLHARHPSELKSSAIMFNCSLQYKFSISPFQSKSDCRTSLPR